MGKTENRSSLYPKSFRVIAVTSGKGGMGKTNIVVNLGLTLAKGGRSVLIMDADLGLANVDVVLGITPKRDLRHLIFEGGDIQDCITSGPEGLDILSGTSGVSELTHLDTEQKWRLLEAFEPLGEKYDTLLIDTSAGIGSNVQFFSSAAQEVILVVGPEPTSLTDAYSTVKVLANKCGVRRVLVCVNRTTSLEAARDVFRQLFTVTTRFLNVVVEFVGWVPHDVSVEQAVMKQQPFILTHPNAPASQGVKSLADSLLRRPPEPGPGGGFQVFWRTLLGAAGEGAV